MSVGKTIAGIAFGLAFGSATLEAAPTAFTVGEDVSNNLFATRSLQSGTTFSGVRTGIDAPSTLTTTFALNRAAVTYSFRMDERIISATADVVEDMQGSFMGVSTPSAAEGRLVFGSGVDTRVVPIARGFTSTSAARVPFLYSLPQPVNASLDDVRGGADSYRDDIVFRFRGTTDRQPSAWAMMLSALGLCGLIARRRMYF